MRPSSTPAAPPERATLPERIGERYLVRALLGRGGMGAVYRVSDGEAGPELALKQLQLDKAGGKRAAVEALFEQEFSVLAQLDHPRVIRVYDYGWDPTGPYYSMELLHGSSLTECAPLPWREACALIHDVCSSLSLLHVRGLVHRDVSPHNVRRTLDGRAKLIDFGAMAPMGPSEQIIGTPAFAAPEVVHRLGLDGRTDLYSLGATLYFALTGRSAYAARNFAQLADAWSERPAPPSLLVNEIPAQLDALVMAMLSLEPALRPRSASEVMLQLATLVGRDDAEHADVSRAYLSTPSLVGRDELRRRFDQRVTRARTR
ncbi:MAG TPA: serine/threonine-protein kinase, partial [Polyangiales bacterium]|nr:serine/threonine-protein kinase [Polyangiales bacterium]